jgi:hypothetical protein
MKEKEKDISLVRHSMSGYENIKGIVKGPTPEAPINYPEQKQKLILTAWIQKKTKSFWHRVVRQEQLEQRIFTGKWPKKEVLKELNQITPVMIMPKP